MAHSEQPLISFADDGTPVFAGTAVPMSELFIHLAEGGDLSGFLTRASAVSEKQAQTAVLLAREAIDLMLRNPGRLRGT
jgi:hypothetical protein